MDDLVAWLTQIWDEQEKRAKAATASPWRYNAQKHTHLPGTAYYEEAVFAGEAGAGATTIAATGETDDPQSMADARFIAANDPASVLARIAADRQILDQVFRYESKIDGEWGCCHEADSIRLGLCPETPVNEIRALRIMASAYQDRPGFRDEWRVT